jgi:succinate dehydrogenase/fumarate reductase flavoprotein subunit
MAPLSKTVDVLVIGSGAGGLSAAVTAGKAGLDVLVVEKGPVFGGTTATSGGVLWVPGTRYAKATAEQLGLEDSRDKVRAYILQEGGNHVDLDKVDSFLEAAPAMVDFMERETEVKFHGMAFPDYHADAPNAGIVRSVGTQPYTAAEFRSDTKRLKNELPQTLFLGLALGSSLEMKYFMKAGRSPTAMAYVVKRMMSHIWDVVRHGESQKFVRGRALIARLARTAFDLGIPIWTDAAAKDLIEQGGAVTGAQVQTKEGLVSVIARYGVVLAAGGSIRDAQRRREVYPGIMGRIDAVSPAPMGNTGDGVRMAEKVGGRYTSDVSNVSAWMPVSKLPDATDFTGIWPHLVDRQKPGFIMVLSNGKRFVDEATSYHDLVPAMVTAFEAEKLDACWLLADARALKRWGMGFVRPFPIPHGHYERSGYLLKGRTLAELAKKAGIDAVQLERTVTAFNANAVKGEDPDFGRGSFTYDRYQGDEEVKPNPCLGPLDQAPFYAVRIYPGDIGSFAGLRTDAKARVLGEGGEAIPNLYAVGNDMVSVFGGAYTGAGAMIGPAMTFGWIAGKDIAARAGRSLP